MEIDFEILISVIQLAVLVGLVVFVVRLVTRRGASSAEGSGIAIRRFFQYTIMLVMGTIAVFGVIGLIDAAALAGTQATRDTSAIARSIAFVVVGVPVFAGLALYTRRRFIADPADAEATGWVFYLTVALIGSLIAAMSYTIAFIGGLIDGGGADRVLLISCPVWTMVWIAHWWTAQRSVDPNRMQMHLLVGSAAGLVVFAIGAGVAITATLSKGYDALFSVTSVGLGVEDLMRGIVLVVVGAAVWSFYWIGHARSTDRTLIWLAYVVLGGVLVGVITAVTGAGAMLFGILDWVIGDVGTVTATTHFAFIPGAIGAFTVGVLAWGYHRSVLGDRGGRPRTEVDRAYDYLLAGAGLLVAASGLATLITVLLDGIGGGEIASTGESATPVALTLLIVGVPLWWRHWSTIRRCRRDDPTAEVGSVTRRVYLFILFGATGLVAVIDLLIVVFIVVEDLLEGSLGAATTGNVAVPISLLITAGAVAWYHFVVYREDRSIIPKTFAPTLQEIIVVGTDETIAAAASITGPRIVAFRVIGQPEETTTLHEALNALDQQTHSRIALVADSQRVTVFPIAD